MNAQDFIKNTRKPHKNKLECSGVLFIQKAC